MITLAKLTRSVEHDKCGGIFLDNFLEVVIAGQLHVDAETRRSRCGCFRLGRMIHLAVDKRHKIRFLQQQMFEM